MQQSQLLLRKKMARLEEVCSLVGHVDCVWHVSWNPSGTLLATCGGDKILRIWGKEGNNYTSLASEIWHQSLRPKSCERYSVILYAVVKV